MDGTHVSRRAPAIFEVPQITAQTYWISRDGTPPPVPVIFLVKTTEDQRDQILKELEAADSPWPSYLPQPRELVVVPWLRNYTPHEDILFEISYPHNDSHIFVDDIGIKGGTCVISHWFRTEGYPSGVEHKEEFARVEWKKAKRLVAGASSENGSWFPNILDEELVPDEEPGETPRGQEEIFVAKDVEYTWPEHLPSDLRLQEGSPTLVSLIHLSQTEIDQLLERIGTDPNMEPPKIFNWPAGIAPGSESDMWHIFNRIKPDWPNPYEEIYGLFIDTIDLHGPDRHPEAILVRRQRLGEVDDPKSFVENNMTARILPADKVLQTWNTGWNPVGTGTWNGIRANEAMQRVRTDTFTHILNPDIPGLINKSELPIFILQPLTSTEEHTLRKFILSEGCYEEEFPLSNVPNGDGTFASLMRYFESPEFRRHNNRPPYDFIAIDNVFLSALVERELRGGGDDAPSLLLATHAFILHHDKQGNEMAHDDVGYIVGRCTMDDGDGFNYWMISSFQGMGLSSYIEYSGVKDQTGAGKYFWSCFDAGEEWEDLITTMS
ncbi:uncharacterized protein BDR25DRAFT_315214 [Lindgomyces ingoldianus]|uniref:Uncharacterized protein n=1 Tax=Lindgomyces ingoldianus TaxID=673940 RepID=A0ACB6QU71_9PLEO|nr:uncharacterized protein BDR25DRAFT_315214 [Lindgomyces ingoldianus]KAF2469625.1 hypothetical protein BDR25DRAFT_315214 [Lindgomyces ingoldianus]